jgi:two-component system, NarL family, sensor histidine kinase DesK
MDGGGGRAVSPPLAWAFATGFLCLTLPAGIVIAAYWAGPAAAAAAAALFPLPLLYTILRGRVLWGRYRNQLLASQALLTFVPFVAFGRYWVVGVSGLLGALLLLTVAAPRSWLLFAAVLAADGMLRVGIVGLPPMSGLSAGAIVFAAPLYLGLALFGLARLGGLVADLHAARSELAALAVAQERLRAARRLHAAVGDRLDAAAARAWAALAALPDNPEQSRAEVAEAARGARQALDQVRAIVTDERHGPARDASPGQAVAAEPTVAPRLARLVLVLVLVTISAEFVLEALTGAAGAWAAAASVAAIVALAGLQLYHSLTWRERARPRGWAWTLAAQLLLTALGFVPVLHAAVHGLGGFVAGSALLLLRGSWGWAAFAGIQVTFAAHITVLPDADTADVAYGLMATVTTGLAVYGLSRLAGLAAEVDETRRELARAAVGRERLRVAQDTHDLLGLGLSAVALKSDLVGRLIGRDHARARGELDALVRLAVQAGSDIQAVITGGHNLSLRTELAAARAVLASAGVDAEVRTEPSGAPLPVELDVALATVLREAVTNVLRHAKATRCEIELTMGHDAVRLLVANDGVIDEPPKPAGGRERGRGGYGLANLAARVAALDGRLTTHAEGGRFALTVQVPLPVARSARPDVEDALAASDPAHGVDEVASGTVLHKES